MESKIIESRVAQNIRRLVLLIFSVVACVIAVNMAAGTALATPGSGVGQTPIASGVLPESVGMKLKHHGGYGRGLDVSSVTIVKNVIQPGGYFGWHQHGGPSWIVVTQGTLTFYDADDPNCTGYDVPAGSVYLDSGDHTHNARNNTNSPVENYVVRVLPEGGVPRLDMPQPGLCPQVP